ncbi:MAG: formate/nitrite transporter family protein [Clostridiales Family XIII bacterium]|jgi:formate/nitrite transporter|nr:formate/nitrite transporter family protein [Clostridiales Family XIII bacterium]
MASTQMLEPQEILDTCIHKAEVKANGGFVKLFVLSFLAGVFIAFAAEGSNMAAFNLFAEADTYGLGKVLAGSIFGTGLMLVLLAGGELFTGNTLIITAVVDKKVRVLAMLRNWLIVYIGNFVGSIFIAWMMYESGLFSSGAFMLGVVTLKIATYKVGLTYLQAFLLGIMCNWLVCLAVWLCYGAESMVGKIFAIFFPIWLFITSGFEHSVANMYYIPAGILSKANDTIVNLALEHGVTQSAIDALTWKSFFINNLIPVTLGNIVGGGVFVGCAYMLAYKFGKKK